MKKLFIILTIISIFTCTGCEKKSNAEEPENKVMTATLNDDGDIVIKEEDITSVATFINYNYEGVTIGLIAVRGTDGIVRIAFNTCQSCSPSPNAYFIQKGEYLICQNCFNKFHIDKIGIEKGGCNPAFVEEQKKEDGIITIASEYVQTMKEKFINWNGPKE